MAYMLNTSTCSILTHRQHACNDAFSIARPVNESHAHGLLVYRRWPISMQSETMRHTIWWTVSNAFLNGLGRISAYKPYNQLLFIVSRSLSCVTHSKQQKVVDYLLLISLDSLSWFNLGIQFRQKASYIESQANVDWIYDKMNGFALICVDFNETVNILSLSLCVNLDSL